MSDAGTEGPWTAFVFHYPSVNSNTDEAGHQTLMVSYNETQHEAREEAEARVKDVLCKLNALNPKINWRGLVGRDVS